MKKLNFLRKRPDCNGIVSTTEAQWKHNGSQMKAQWLRFVSVLVLVLTFGVGQMWGAGATLLATYTFENGATMPSNVTNSGGVAFSSTRFCFDTKNDYIVITPTIPNTATKLYIQVKGIMNNSGTTQGTTGTIGIYGLTSTNSAVAGASGTFSQSQANAGSVSAVDNNAVDETEISFSATNVKKIKINEDSHNKKYIIKSVTITYDETPSCSNSVSISTGTPTNATISVNSTGVETCSSTASERQVTVSVAPANCYAAPVAASVTKTGTAASSATRKSGPTWNNTTSKYDYVFEFSQNASGAISFNVSLSTKNTYTVNFNKGNAAGATGDASSDTKTCGEALTLPNSALFTRTGYTQQGWSTAQAGTTKTYNLGGSYTTDAATTLYPYWQAKSYSVTWIVNNAPYTTGGGSTSVNHDSRITSVSSAPNPLPCGDKFIGWTDVEDYVHEVSPLYKTANDFPIADGEQTFYAVFADYDE